jgi:class 3 adenylate cyclase/tetratricopeptide (TPR) repeat protein
MQKVESVDPRPLVITILREGAFLRIWLTDLLPIGRPTSIELGDWLSDLRACALGVPGPEPSQAPQSIDGGDATVRLRHLGGTIFRRFFPEAIREFLAQSPARHLYLQIDDSLMGIPWELAFDGKAFLGEKFSISRRLGAAAVTVPKAKPGRDTLRVLLIRGESSSPACDTYEADLSRRLSAIEDVSCTRADASVLPHAKALRLFAEHDIVHYIGPVGGGTAGDADVAWWPGVEAVSMRQVATLAATPQLLISENCRNADDEVSESSGEINVAKGAARMGLNILLRKSDLAGDASVEFMVQIYRELVRGAALGVAVRCARVATRRPARIESGPHPEAVLYGDAAQIVFPPNERVLQQGNRRQVTVMSCDIVESTRLLRTLGAEKYSDVLWRYHNCCASIVSRYGGSMSEPKGDGFLCFFGFPIAQEDCATQSLKAGRDIIDAVAGLGVSVRIGIDTGQVAVREGDPVGDVVHFAARLESKAEPGTMRVSDTTRQLVKGKFEFRLIEGIQDIKGFDKPGPVYVALGETEADAADLYDTARRLTPFVGRARELQLIEDHWSAAQANGMRTVLVSGEAGIGKSRLVTEFKRSLMARGSNVILARCTPDHTTSAFHPVINFLRRLLQIQDSDDVKAKLDKIDASVPRTNDAAPLIAALLSIPSGSRYPKLQLPAEKLRQLTLNALTSWIKQETGKSPLCAIVEDIHWIDPSTKEFLNRLVAEAAALPLLVITTTRSDAAHRWSRLSSIHEIELDGLSPESARAMVIGACGDSTLPGEMVRLLAARADGVPLFIEESTRMAVDFRLATGASDAVSMLEFAVPTTIQDLLMARLDRLESAKPVAQVAGTIGREFSLALLEAVLAHESTPVHVDDLGARLRDLVSSGLVIENDESSSTSYFFKHALVRDAAYQSLWERDRKKLHRAIATVIAGEFKDLEETQPELLAHHYTEAGNQTEAILYWERAARHAASRSAQCEAISHLKKGLELLERLPPPSDRNRTELRFQLLLAARLIATEGYGAEQVERAYVRASELCREVGDEGALLKAQLGLEGYHFMRADFDRAREIANQVDGLLIRLPDATRQLQAKWAIANILFHQGELMSAVERMDACLVDYRDARHHPDAVQDVGVMCLCYSSWGKWELGYPDQALQRANAVVELATRLDHRFSMGEAHGFRAAVLHFRGENEFARADAERAIRICEDHGFPVWLAHAKLMHGRVVAELGEPGAGIEEMRQAYEMWAATGAVVTTPFYLAMQAEGFALANRPDEGLVLLEKALEIVRRCGERYYEAEIRRLFGELTLQSAAMRRTDRSEAEQWFLGGLEFAEAAKLYSLRLRCATSLSRLWSSQGRLEDATLVLTPAYEWFDEGSDTRDLDCARVLLKQLQATNVAG